jgi:2-phospho-L-lactate guanylyltransferase
VLDDRTRQRLARELFEHVLGVLSRHAALAGVAIITKDGSVAELAAARNALVFDEPIGRSDGTSTLAEIVDAGLETLRRRGAGAALVMMSDLPELAEADIDLLMRALADFDVVVVSDERGSHTNALGLRLSEKRRTHFGSADSFRRHCESAFDAGLSLATPSSSGLAFDVDLPEDLVRSQVCARLKRYRSSRASST